MVVAFKWKSPEGKRLRHANLARQGVCNGEERLHIKVSPSKGIGNVLTLTFRLELPAIIISITAPQPLGKSATPVAVTTFDIQKYRDALEDAGRKPTGVNRRLAALRVFFAWAIEAGHASANSVQRVNGIKQEARTPKTLTSQEVYRLQREAAAQRRIANSEWQIRRRYRRA